MENLPQPEPNRLRASDADRDRIADILREALAEGRLSAEEHSERLDRVYRAKTQAELAPLVADLPVPRSRPRPSNLAGGTTPAPSHQPTTIVAIFGGADRKGRWLVEPQTQVVAVFGGVDLDLRDAVFTQREVTFNVVCLFGGVDVKVPPGVRVVSSNVAVFGGTSIPPDDTDDPDAPVIRFTGVTLFGGMDVKRRPRAGSR